MGRQALVVPLTQAREGEESPALIYGKCTAGSAPTRRADQLGYASRCAFALNLARSLQAL